MLFFTYIIIRNETNDKLQPKEYANRNIIIAPMKLLKLILIFLRRHASRLQIFNKQNQFSSISEIVTWKCGYLHIKILGTPCYNSYNTIGAILRCNFCFSSSSYIRTLICCCFFSVLSINCVDFVLKTNRKFSLNIVCIFYCCYYYFFLICIYLKSSIN